MSIAEPVTLYVVPSDPGRRSGPGLEVKGIEYGETVDSEGTADTATKSKSCSAKDGEPYPYYS